jgi:broad specificity phosphatase PhoE
MYFEAKERLHLQKIVDCGRSSDDCNVVVVKHKHVVSWILLLLQKQSIPSYYHLVFNTCSLL